MTQKYTFYLYFVKQLGEVVDDNKYLVNGGGEQFEFQGMFVIPWRLAGQER